MHPFKKSKFNAQRPGSSARVCDTEISDYEKKSRIPKLPERTYSFEGKGTHLGSRQSKRNESGTVSMIPRLDRKKECKKDRKPSTAPVREEKYKTVESTRNLKETEFPRFESSKGALVSISDQKPSSKITDSCVESRINESFVNFKSNVLRIPEYWTDASHTVTNVLKNAVSIVAKQYPSTDVEAFEVEIQNILKATETVKYQILAKTEDIIKQANKIYVYRSKKEGELSEEELEALTQKMEELKNKVHARKNVFEDLLKCGSEINDLMGPDNEFREKVELRDTSKSIRKEIEMEWEKTAAEGRNTNRAEMKKSKMVIESSPKDMRRQENVTQSCGDVLRQESGAATKAEIIPGASFQKGLDLLQQDKYTQTINLWTAELHQRDEDLAILNGQILELHRLCKDHISKFKSFNLQIKLRGICNRAQHTSVSKEIQILNDKKQFAEKNNKLQYYSKDLETAVKRKNLNLYQRDKVINQEKRLLHVRDEIIEMLKTKCGREVEKCDLIVGKNQI